MNFSEKRNILLLCSLLFFFLSGESLILPILAPTLAEPICDKLDMLANSSKQLHNLAYGAALGVFPVCLFFAAPIIGSLSDNYARKPLIIAGSGISQKYAVFVVYFTGVGNAIYAFFAVFCRQSRCRAYNGGRRRNSGIFAR